VVQLRDNGDVTHVEPLCDVHLPERSVGIERRFIERGRKGRELCSIDSSARRPVSNVEPHVDLRLLDPHRKVEPERKVEQPLPQRRDEVKPVGDVAPEAFEAVAAGNGRRVESDDRHHVESVHRGLRGEEERIERSKTTGPHPRSVGTASRRPVGPEAPNCRARRSGDPLLAMGLSAG